MREIRRFLKTLAWALVPVAAVNLLLASALVLLSVREDLAYVNYASAFDKERRLDSLAGQPRLVAIGGSNARFCLHSGLLLDSLGMEPVNMGIHIGLGLDFMLGEVEHRLAGGDVLLVSAEYNHYFSTETYYGDEGLTDMLLMKHEWGKAFAHVAETQNYFSLYSLLRRRLKRKDMRPEDIPARMEVRTKYNRYGDYVGHYGLSALPWSPSPLPAEPSREVLDDLARRVSALRGRGVRVVVLPPPYACSAYQLNRSAIAALDSLLRQEGLAFGAPPSAMVYPDSLFYDSQYHLTGEGGLKYSRQLAGLLHSLGVSPRQR